MFSHKKNIAEALRSFAVTIRDNNPNESILDPNTVVPALMLDRRGNIMWNWLSHNSFPNGVLGNPERLERPEKYVWIEHAERNLIYRAAKHGIPLDGLTMCLLWFPCADCARAIIQSGIKRLLVGKSTDEPRWRFDAANQMLIEAGVQIHYHDTDDNWPFSFL